jgi:hypothetical protein
MKNSLLLLVFFCVTSCVSVPRSTQNDILEIKKMVQTLQSDVKTSSIKSQNQISELNENYQTILKGIVKPSNVVTNYDNLNVEQLDSIRAVRGLIKKK